MDFTSLSLSDYIISQKFFHVNLSLAPHFCDINRELGIVYFDIQSKTTGIASGSWGL